MNIKEMLEKDITISIYPKNDFYQRYIFSDRIMGFKKAGAIITASVDQDYITYRIHDVNGKFIHAYLLEV